jgi:hypothetical protein
VEDSRVELKQQWPEIEKAARRIAGHANSCFGTEILWIIGLDEDSGVVGVQPDELADWWAQVSALFDGVVPSLTDLVLQVGTASLVCLLFETDRPPYVVKNIAHGQQGGGPVKWEVPWREGTAVRTAGRNELLRILVSTVALPELEILNGSGSLHEVKDYPYKASTKFALHFSLSLYLVPRSDNTIVIPFHRCQCVVSDSTGQNTFDDFKIELHRPSSFGVQGSSPDSVTMDRTSNELIARGPGRCTATARAEFKARPEWLTDAALQVRFVLAVIDCELPLDLQLIAKPGKPGKDELATWQLSQTG